MPIILIQNILLLILNQIIYSKLVKMLSNRLLISVRLFNTSCVVQNNARVMKKIMGTTKK